MNTSLHLNIEPDANPFCGFVLMGMGINYFNLLSHRTSMRSAMKCWPITWINLKTMPILRRWFSCMLVHL